MSSKIQSIKDVLQLVDTMLPIITEKRKTWDNGRETGFSADGKEIVRFDMQEVDTSRAIFPPWLQLSMIFMVNGNNDLKDLVLSMHDKDPEVIFDAIRIYLDNKREGENVVNTES
jgi:hypothetical protein